MENIPQMAAIIHISLIQEDVEPGRSQVPLSKDKPSSHDSFKRLTLAIWLVGGGVR